MQQPGTFGNLLSQQSCTVNHFVIYIGLHHTCAAFYTRAAFIVNTVLLEYFAGEKPLRKNLCVKTFA